MKMRIARVHAFEDTLSLCKNFIFDALLPRQRIPLHRRILLLYIYILLLYIYIYIVDIFDKFASTSV